MTLAFLGSAGIGLVWGWLLYYRFPSGQHRWRNAIILLLATLAIGWEVMSFSGMRLLVVFFLSTALALFVHVVWKRMLQDRYGTSQADDSKIQ